MPTRRTRVEQRAQTRESLLVAAAELFAERGYATTSVDAIAERAGYTSGAVYDHFGSKQGLLVAGVERLVAEDPLREQLGPGRDDSLEDQLRSIGRTAGAQDHDARDVALTYEVYALALRNPDLGRQIGTIIGHQLRSLGTTDTPGNLSGTDLVVLGQALLDGLKLRAQLNPELVRPELFEEGLAALAPLAAEESDRN